MAKIYHFINVLKIKEEFGIKAFVETGTADGLQFVEYIQFGIDKYYSCEINKDQYNIAMANVGHISNVNLFNQSSVDFFTELLPKIKDVPTLFWLDAHLPGSEIGLPLSYEQDVKLRMPLEDEIDLICKYKNTDNDVLLCDDLRHYEDGNFGSGNWEDRKTLGGDNINFIYEKFGQTHDIVKNYNYGGCVILTPKKKDVISIGVAVNDTLIGTLGDTLCLTPILEELHNREHAPICVSTLLPDLFLNNPYVQYVSNIIPTISVTPSTHYENSIVELYSNQLGLDIPKGVSPKIYLSSEEIEYGKNALKDLDGFKKIAISLETKADCRNLRYEFIAPLLERLRMDGYKLIGVGGSGVGKQYNYDLTFVNKTTIREVASIISQCELFLGIDAGLFHVAAAVNVPQVIFFRNNKSSNNSYFNTYFIDSNIECSGKCLEPFLESCRLIYRCMDNFDLDEYYKLITKILPMNNKTCYVVNFYLGNRRFDIDTYKTDKLCYLRYQIETLQKYRHSLSKIVFNFNVEPDHYDRLNEALKIIPPKIQNADVEINIRKNIGFSYGAFSDIFGKYMNKYDYYIFNEDDYVFVQDNFDKYLVGKFNSLPNCGYLCGIVRETTPIHQKHAGMSSGISSFEVLKKVYDRYGELPYGKTADYSNNECVSQVGQSNAIIQLGYEIYDIREDYRIQMKSAEKIDGHNVVHRYFIWNNEDLLLSTNLYLNEYHIWRDFIDQEYLRMECDTKSTKYFKYGN